MKNTNEYKDIEESNKNYNITALKEALMEQKSETQIKSLIHKKIDINQKDNENKSLLIFSLTLKI